MPCAPKLKPRNPETENKVDVLRFSNTAEIDLDHLRSVLHRSPTRSEFLAEDGAAGELTPASVLFPIVLRADGPTVLFTQRTDDLRDHPGQISFPGGRVEPEDRSPAHTALREAKEEIGLSPAPVEIIGYLPEYRTGTGFRVTPVVALLTPPFALRPDPREVANIFEVPLAFLLDSANHQQHSAFYRGKQRQYVAMPYGEYFIWGATAGIIATLARAFAA